MLNFIKQRQFQRKHDFSCNSIKIKSFALKLRFLNLISLKTKVSLKTRLFYAIPAKMTDSHRTRRPGCFLPGLPLKQESVSYPSTVVLILKHCVFNRTKRIILLFKFIKMKFVMKKWEILF